MKRWIWILLSGNLLLQGVGALSVTAADRVATEASSTEPGQLWAWYRSEGIKARGATVVAWENATGAPTTRVLNRIVGTPRVWRVSARGEERAVVRLDGSAALWQTRDAWGVLSGDRTVIALVRLGAKGEGFLFDGSTNTGMTRARVMDGKWQVGVQPPPITNADRSDPETLAVRVGEWQVHVFEYKKTATGTEIVHRNGDEVKTAASDASSSLGGFILGANVATRKGLACDVAELMVFDRIVTGEELSRVVSSLRERWSDLRDLPASKQPRAESLPDDPRIFRTILRKRGDDNVDTYRIPGLATTRSGTLIAVFDVRHKSGADLPGDIDVGMMRSTDGGQTWSPMQRIMDYDASVAGSRGNGVGDPAILVDQRTGTVFVAALYSKGNRAWAGSGPGWSPEETGQFVICHSRDEGLTWSKPTSITRQVKKEEWQLCFQGPGNGIQTKDGTLVFPAQFKGADKIPHSCFVASIDGGKTWTISPPAVPDKPPTSECAIAELSDGSLLLSMRNEARTGQRVWARWDWKDSILQGKWTEPWLDLPDPTCMASLIRHPRVGLLFCNPNNSQRRDHLTVRVSQDDGRTWSRGKLIDPGVSMYSSLTVLKDGRIGMVYESGDAGALVFVRFPWEWLLEADDSPE